MEMDYDLLPRCRYTAMESKQREKNYSILPMEACCNEYGFSPRYGYMAIQYTQMETMPSS